ncbi:MAG: ribonuclease HI [Alphaproteobacteria bacterium]|nr:ribonuclease HI [Alphaproteobacteria bacterium]
MSYSYILYTDGACSGNPGPGGWGVFMQINSRTKELNGYDPSTTNNRMEMMAVIKGLLETEENSHVTVYTDSQYLQKGMQEWLSGWKKRNWKTASGSAVKNKDLWQKLDTLSRVRSVEWCWVKGHAGNAGNERADALARAAISKKA